MTKYLETSLMAATLSAVIAVVAAAVASGNQAYPTIRGESFISTAEDRRRVEPKPSSPTERQPSLAQAGQNRAALIAG